MKSFTKLTGLVAPMDRANVDTDQIIPEQFSALICTGFGEFLFWTGAARPTAPKTRPLS